MRDPIQKIGLKNLCKWANIHNLKKTAVEIGAYSGEGTEIISNFFEKIIAIDPWINGYDKNDLASEQAPMELVFRSFIQRTCNIKNIKYIPTTSEYALKFFEEKSIDFLYIDGNHQFESVFNDINLWKNKIKDRGVISGHDFSFTSVQQALNYSFKDKEIKLFEGDSWGIIL